jgi:putative oxidoreductase
MTRSDFLTRLPRLLLGLIFVLGAIDGFYYVFVGHELIVFPETEVAHQFTHALRTSGFFWPYMKTLQLIGGLSLLTNILAPVGFLLLLPIIVTIILFHFVINWPGAIFGVVLLALSVTLFFQYMWFFRRLLRGKE